MPIEDFDQKALNWDADPTRVERARVVAEAIRSNVPLSPMVQAIEYGCGTGLLSFALQPHLGKITLADSSTGMLAVLSQKILSSGVSNMQPLRLDLATDVQPDATWDLVYSLMVLHHIPDTDQILSAFYQLLNPGGYLCIADLDEEDGSFHGPEISDVHHGFKRDVLGQQVKAAGFRVVRFSTVYQMDKMMETHIQKTFPVFLMVAEK
jgi:ubiquinone/menaquinone biosynthesis C-methylase UbiE